MLLIENRIVLFNQHQKFQLSEKVIILVRTQKTLRGGVLIIFQPRTMNEMVLRQMKIEIKKSDLMKQTLQMILEKKKDGSTIFITTSAIPLTLATTSLPRLPSRLLDSEFIALIISACKLSIPICLPKLLIPSQPPKFSWNISGAF